MQRCARWHVGPPAFATAIRRTFLSRNVRDLRTHDFLRLLSHRMRSAEQALRRHDPAAQQRAFSIAKKSLQRLCGTDRDVEDTEGERNRIEERILRFAFIATMVAFGGGQSELLHLDWGDQHTTYNVISVFSTEGWKSDKRQGWLVLPTLNVEIEMKPGSFSSVRRSPRADDGNRVLHASRVSLTDPGFVIFFQASLLPHFVRALDADDLKKRLVVTLFTCHGAARNAAE